MIVICDTSPITNLIQIGHLNLLKDLFNKIIIPEKVFEELCFYEHQKALIENTDWIEINKVKEKSAVLKLEHILDSGEAEAIILAKELNSDYLMIDERKGRKVAQDFGLKVIGLLGILIAAKQKGFILAVKPLLVNLKEKAGFRIQKDLYERVLLEVNE